MLINPRTGQPLIEGVLALAGSNGWRATVITRAEKRVLVEHLRGRDGVRTLTIDATREWPESLLRSEAGWDEYNLVLLPDTEFEPTTAANELIARLDAGAPTAFAVFDTREPALWGLVCNENGRGFIAEKPVSLRPGAKAWGAFAFRRSVGRRLLERLTASTVDHEWKQFGPACPLVPLTRFEDLTRFMV